MINWFNIPDEGLSDGGLFEVKELEVTENGTYETKGEMYNKVTVNVEGGGGESDFSTAEVTLINTASRSMGTLNGFPHIVNDELYGGNKHVPEGTLTVTAVLFKGVLYCSIVCEEITSSEGSVEVDDVDLTIRGDCTITIKGYPDV